MKNSLKRIIAVGLALSFVFLVSCSGSKSNDEITELSFSQSVDIVRIKELNGKRVTIIGYMASASALDGSFMYLMNMPYQTCPFCKPNTTQLSNTLAVYAKDGSKFEFTDFPIKVTGKIDVGEYTDSFGYSYNYRITDASYVTVDMSKSDNEKLALWYSIASDGIPADIYTMFDYVYFLSHWTEYFVRDDNGNIAYYLYPADVENYLKDDKFGYAAQYADSYFPSLIAKIHAVSNTELEQLVSIIERAKILCADSLTELRSEKYTYKAWDEKEGEFIYTLNNASALDSRYNDLFGEFYSWLSEWEI